MGRFRIGPLRKQISSKSFTPKISHFKSTKTILFVPLFILNTDSYSVFQSIFFITFSFFSDYNLVETLVLKVFMKIKKSPQELNVDQGSITSPAESVRRYQKGAAVDEFQVLENGKDLEYPRFMRDFRKSLIWHHCLIFGTWFRIPLYVKIFKS